MDRGEVGPTWRVPVHGGWVHGPGAGEWEPRLHRRALLVFDGPGLLSLGRSIKAQLTRPSFASTTIIYMGFILISFFREKYFF